MPPFSINWREVAVGVFAFIVVMIGFGVLSAVIRWPSERDGWPLAVGIAAIVAFLPLMARGFTFLQQSRASFEGPFGIKLNFSAAAAVATIGSAKLPDNLVEPGVVIHESSSKELNEAAVRATEQGVAVVNLEDGRAWYLTRLFALAATADFLHAPKSLVLVGQRGGRPMQVLGWIRPRDFVNAVTRSDPRYQDIWRRAQAYLYRLQSKIVDDNQFAKLPRYQSDYDKVGAAAIMSILVNQMRYPEMPPGAATPSQPLEDDNAPPWITPGGVIAMLDPWLVRDTLDLGKTEHEQAIGILNSREDIAVAIRDGQYAGLIDVGRAERELLRQLVERPASQ